MTGELKSQIDKVWEAFWTGGLSNPLTVIEQMTYLLFIKRLDELQLTKEEQASFMQGHSTEYHSVVQAVQDPLYTEEEAALRWSYFKNMDTEIMFQTFTKPNGVFDFLRNIGNRSAAFSRFMKGATFMIPTPRLLGQVVEMISNINMNDRDTKGDVYEYLLSKIASAGQNGQFRTPRHIIRMMVDMVQPTLEDTICDPSAGTCGFLTVASEYIREHFKDDILKDDHKKHFEDTMFMGMEFDPTMIRIGAMNLILHGIENPQLLDVDALSEANTTFTEKASLVLANPPFKGSLDREAVDGKILSVVDSKKTELLFLALILKGLTLGGRAAVIVPDGVLFGSSNAHQQLRKELIDRQKLQAVISMPSGVFKPYAGVSTAVLLFTKTDSGGTDKVWFYDMQADGFSLDDKRQPIEKNDIADIVSRFNSLTSANLTSARFETSPTLNAAENTEGSRLRTDKSFLVPVEEIRDNKYDLSINRYKEVVYEEKTYLKPQVIIQNIEDLDAERRVLMNELKMLLG
jgi:type I restriction enzyme M protein